MDTLIPVNIIVGDRSYRIRLAPKDEEVVRKIVKIINDKILEFKTQFAGKDMQDYIAMVVLWYATQENAAGDKPFLPNQMEEKFDHIETLLNKALHKE